jgi:hypothetical protein
MRKTVLLCVLLACCTTEPPLPPPPPPAPPRPPARAASRPKVTPAVRSWIEEFRRSEKQIPNAVTHPDASPEEIRAAFEKDKAAQERLQKALDQGAHATPETLKAAHDAVNDFNAAVKPRTGSARRKKGEMGASPAFPPYEPPPPPVPPPPSPPPTPAPPSSDGGD